jgi:hypothetical protein
MNTVIKLNKILTLFLLLFFCFNGVAQNGPNCPSGVCIGPGGSITSGSLTVALTSFYSSITIKTGQTLTVKSGYTLYVGQVTNSATTQVVDFQNGCNVLIESGASLVVYGLLNNSNNSNGVIFNGSVLVAGNVTGGNGSTIVGAGTLDASGTIITDNSGSIFNSTGDCSTGPCSGTALNCTGSTNTISGNQIICTGTIPAILTGSNTDSGATYQWQNSTTFGANFIDITSATNSSYSPSALNTTTYYRRKKTFSGCIGTSSQVAVSVSAYTSPLPPTVGTIIQPDCKNPTGSVVLTGLPAGGIVNPGNISYLGTSATISSLVPGNYTYTVTNGTGCNSPSLASANVVIVAAATNSFNGSTWSNGSPNSSQTLIFNGNFSSTGDLSACSCQVASGTVVINSDHTLKVTNGITVSGGSLTFENNASLVQTNDAAINSGNIIYKRTTSVLANNYDFEYWGSPVIDQTLGTIWMASNLNDTFYNFDSKTTNNWVRSYAADKMIAGKGYISRARNGQSGLDYNNVSSTFTVGGTWTAKFYGVPNNGVITVQNCTYPNYCLLGNPYPSAIDADAFLLKNNLVLGGTLYFWTHNTAINNNTYTSNDYASYNGVGGTATSKSISSGSNINVPSGKIAAGQAFFATAITTNDVVFDNSMRVDNAGNSLNNTQFFKSNSNNKTASGIEKSRIWLNLANDQGAFKQILVGYVTDATNDFDESFDGKSLNGNSFINFYSINQNRNFTIQGRALPFDENDIVPLGFKTNISGAFKINIDQSDGLIANHSVFLLDKLTDTRVDLQIEDYTFSTAIGTFNDRFVLYYSNASLAKNASLANTAIETANKSVLVYAKNGQLKINSYSETLDKVLVYDLLGRQIYLKANLNAKELSISNLGSNQTVLVKTSLQNGSVFTDTIIL